MHGHAVGSVTVTVFLEETERIEVHTDLRRRRGAVMVDQVTVSISRDSRGERLRLSGRGYRVRPNGNLNKVRESVHTLLLSQLSSSVRAYIEGMYENALADLPQRVDLAA
jgi:hypothetical protein